MTAKRTVMTGKWHGYDNKTDGYDSLFIMLGTVMMIKGDGHDTCLLYG